MPADKMGFTADSLAKQGRKIGFLASTSVNKNAADTAAGGPYTQALVKALGIPENVNPFTRAVTVQTAHNWAASSPLALSQHAHMFGSLDDLPLAWPIASQEFKAIPNAGAAPDAWTKTLSARIVTSRGQVVHESHRVEGKSLIIQMTFGHETHFVRTGIHYPEGDKEATPRPEMLKPFKQPMRPGDTTEIVVPLASLPTKGKHRVTIQACETKDKCGAPDAFAAELP